jgi:hypothetical protein
MKRVTKILACAFIATLAIYGCNKSDDSTDISVEGTYAGTLTTKSATGTLIGSSSATADISKAGEGLIQVHCFGTELDTTFMLNYYENRDSIMVCFTGADFQNTYGHMMGHGHMMGGMMGDIKPGQSQWQHHMADEHKAGDKHYGGFDMMNHSFGYTFHNYNGGNHMIMNFEGTKK